MANRLCCVSSQECIPYKKCTQWIFTDYGSKQPGNKEFTVDDLQYNNFYNFNIESSINEIKVTSKLKLDYNISAETKTSNGFGTVGTVAAKRNAVYELLNETYQTPFYWQPAPFYGSSPFFGSQLPLSNSDVFNLNVQTSIPANFLIAHHSRNFYWLNSTNLAPPRLYYTYFNTISNVFSAVGSCAPEARIFKSFQLKKGIYKFSLVNMHLSNVNMGTLCRSRIPYLLCKNSNSRFYGFYRERALWAFNSLNQIIDGPSYNLDYNGGLPIFDFFGNGYAYFNKILYPSNISSFWARNLRESDGLFGLYQPTISYPPNGDYIIDVPGNTQVTFTLYPAPKYNLKQEDLSENPFPQYSKWGFPRKISSENSKGKETISFFGLYGDNICNDETENSITLAAPVRAFNEAAFSRSNNFICGNNINI